MATTGVIPHRLIPGTTVSICEKPLNLRYANDDGYGHGICEWDQYDEPDFEVGDPVLVTVEGGEGYVGEVSSISSGVGERILHHVVCKGPAEVEKCDGTVEGVFVDRDLAQWHVEDSGWEAWPEGQINVELTDKLAFFWPGFEPESEAVIVDVGESVTGYSGYEGNSAPPFHASDFPKSKTLWSACYYRIGEGATSKKISGVYFQPTGWFAQPQIDALTTPDYNSPTPPVVPAGEDADYFGETESERNRFATYPDINLWSGLYGAAPPENCFLALYCVDDLAQLPTADPEAMERSPYMIYKFAHVNYESSGPLFIECDGRFLVWYAAYKPIRFPMESITRYSSEAAHLLRCFWVARNRLMAQRGQWAYVYNLSVYAQGYRSLANTDDDLADVFRILDPDCDVPRMVIPHPLDGSPGTTIAIRNATTMPAATADLLAMYPKDMAFGWWGGGLRIREKPDGAYVVYDEPGVDTTAAGTTNEGVVDLVLVSYVATAATPQQGALSVAGMGFVVVDQYGTYEIVDETWEPSAGSRCVFINGTDVGGLAAAVKKGQAVAIEQRPGQGCGQVVLRAIAGAALVRSGCSLAGPGIAPDTCVTGVSVDVASDTVNLALGHSGYVGRFSVNIPGQPMSTTPSNATRPATTLDLRRSAGR